MSSDSFAMLDALRTGGESKAKSRIKSLVDADSFVEIEAYYGQRTGEGVACGYAVIDGRPVFVYAHQPEKQGALSIGQADKIAHVIEKAVKTGTPLVGILSSCGACLSDGLPVADGYGRIIKAAADASGVIPHIVVIDGPAVGALALYAACADFAVAGKSANVSIGIGGTALDNAACAKAGNTAFSVDSDAQADATVKQLLQYLPDNNLSECDIKLNGDDINRLCPELDAMASIDVHAVLASVCDNGAYVEPYSALAPEIVTAFASIDGQSVGIIANNGSINGGRLTVKGCRKAARFASFCGAFSIPLVMLVDSEGFASCPNCEGNGAAAGAAALPRALAQCQSPVITVIIGKAIGSAYIAMGSKSLGADVVYAWANATIGLLNADAAFEMAGTDILSECDNPVLEREKYVAGFAKQNMNAVNAAQTGLIDEPIMPSETRLYLGAALQALSTKREQKPLRRNAVLPL